MLRTFLRALVFIFIALLSTTVSAAEKPADKNADQLELGEVVVTGTREKTLLTETPQSVGIVKREDIKDIKPSHPSEIMNRIPGVWVNVTAGEGHTTAIRQPIGTNPVYLYLEDGIPIRPTGFFNHNALYEVNMPQADRIEVTKGPSTALYGSDAIGGTVNVMTRPAPRSLELEINPEAGEFGWYRLLASGGNTFGANGFRLDLNETHSDGWRDRTGYDRQSATLRIDSAISDTFLAKTVLTLSNIDQKTGGTSTLTKYDYETRPQYNYQTFDFRQVRAYRLSTELNKEFSSASLLSLIPYVRHNEMDLMPGWGISKSGAKYYGYDATTEFDSVGMLLKYRHNFEPWRTTVIAGLDLDYSPGSYYERRIDVRKTGDRYTSYTYVTNTTNNFDYDAVFTGISPYLQLETSPVKQLRLTAGARADFLSYDYETNLAANANRPANTTRDFSHISPKLGATVEFAREFNAFASYSNAFRAPSSGDLFRGSSGTAATAVNLKPIKADSYETGFRGDFGGVFNYDTSIYYMEKKDDIVSYSPATNVSQRLNAGKTEHKGVEAAVGIKPVKDLDLGTSYTYAVHTYEEYVVSRTLDYSGKEIPAAPRQIINTRIAYHPSFLKGARGEVEWMHLGGYWLDNANTEKYDGHDLFNIRAAYAIDKHWEIYARVINLTDKLFAESASKSGSDAAMFAPGQPRTFFAGITWNYGSAKP
jgi:outer membrane receptor protein involved in Fe transport